MLMAQSMFKINREIKSLDELVEILKKNLDPKFEITVEKAGSGIKSVLFGSTDGIKIKKNAFHALGLSMSERAEGVDYQAISTWMYVPNWLLDQVIGHTGVIDKLIGNLIFGNGKDLYDKVEEIIVTQLDGKPVDTGFFKSAKAALKGKTVFDEE